MDACLHVKEDAATNGGTWLHHHILHPPEKMCTATRLTPSLTASCLQGAGDANWTAAPKGLADGRPECGRTWLRTACARELFAGRDALFIGNSVVRRQMYTLVDLLAGPAARRLHQNREIMPTAFHADNGVLTDTALQKQEGVLSPRVSQVQGGPWSETTLAPTRLWDRDGDPNAYHAAQLVTLDLQTGEHRFDRPHALCGLPDTFMKFHNGRMAQFRSPDRVGGRSGNLGADWRQTKWATREWRPMVSFRMDDAAAVLTTIADTAATCAEPPQTFTTGAWPPTTKRAVTSAIESGGTRAGTPLADGLRKQVYSALGAHLRGLPSADAHLDEWLPNVTVEVELPARTPSGPNVWILLPTYHGERQAFNGFCEDKPAAACACTGIVGDCTLRGCRGKHKCSVLPANTAAYVDHARSFAAAIMAGSTSLGSHPRDVRTSVWYDDCWEGRGRCQGRRPCLEPGDHMLRCRANAMLCPEAPWADVLARAKRWIPATHPSASMLYLFDGANQDLFDETFRTWHASSVGFHSSPIVFGPQFASIKPRQLNASLHLISQATRAADRCQGAVDGGSRGRTGHTQLIFRTPAFNIDPVNTFKQQAHFSRRVRPMVEAAGATFLDAYPATRNAVLQPTSHAIRFDHFSTFRACSVPCRVSAGGGGGAGVGAGAGVGGLACVCAPPEHTLAMPFINCLTSR